MSKNYRPGRRARSHRPMSMASSSSTRGEKTSPQLVSFYSGQELQKSLPSGVTYATLRAIRKDPTVALGRALLGAAVLAGEWSVEATEDAPEGAVDFIRDMFVPLREVLMSSAVFAGIDYGWAAYEKVFDVNAQGEVVLRKLKQLLPDLTTILIDDSTGAFNGYKQMHATNGGKVVLEIEDCLHIGFRVEGTQWHGESLLENVRVAMNLWTECNLSASNFDKKIAGTHFAVYYPPGTSKLNGVDTDNGEVAKALLTALENSGSVTVPATVAQYVDELNKDSLNWKIEILESGNHTPTFVERLRYLDSLKVRAMLLPERAVLEGQFGTRAEAGEHADMAITNIQLTDRHITRHINWYAVDDILAMNYGPDARGTVELVAAPLVDEQIAFLRTLMQSILANPQGFMEEFGNINMQALRDKLGVPTQEQPEEEEVQPGVGQLPEGATGEQLEGMSMAFIPRVENGKWTRNAAGLGKGYEDIDLAFTEARDLADQGLFAKARMKLFGLRKAGDKDAQRRIEYRRTNMLQRFLIEEHGEHPYA